VCCAAEHDIRAECGGLTADGVSVGCTAGGLLVGGVTGDEGGILVLPI